MTAHFYFGKDTVFGAHDKRWAEISWLLELCAHVSIHVFVEGMGGATDKQTRIKLNVTHLISAHFLSLCHSYVKRDKNRTKRNGLNK